MYMQPGLAAPSFFSSPYGPVPYSTWGRPVQFGLWGYEPSQTVTPDAADLWTEDESFRAQWPEMALAPAALSFTALSPASAPAPVDPAPVEAPAPAFSPVSVPVPEARPCPPPVAEPTKPFRTRPCKYAFSARGCKHGNDCAFNHDPAFRAGYRSQQTCRQEEQEGRCNRSACPFKHSAAVHPREAAVVRAPPQLHPCPNNGCTNQCLGQQCKKCHFEYTKGLPCTAFFGAGECEAGDDCHYSHDDEVYNAHHGLTWCKTSGCGNRCREPFDYCKQCNQHYYEVHPLIKCAGQGCLHQTRDGYCRSCAQSYRSRKA